MNKKDLFSPGLALLGSDEGIWVVGWSHETAVSQMGEGGDEWRARNEAKGKQRKITREEKRRDLLVGWWGGGWRRHLFVFGFVVFLHHGHADIAGLH